MKQQQFFISEPEGELKCLISRHKRARYFRMTLRPDGWFRVTVPFSVSKISWQGFICQRKDWMKNRMAELQEKQNKHPDIWIADPEHYKRHKETARQVITERLCWWNDHYRFSYGRVAIRSTFTRWGSCSSDGNLNFNYKIIFLPSELRDYVIVHELCHLKELNHSERFWQLVAETMPDYRRIRHQLREEFR